MGHTRRHSVTLAQVLDAMRALPDGQAVTVAELGQRIGHSDDPVRRAVEQGRQRGLIVQVTPWRGTEPATWAITALGRLMPPGYRPRSHREVEIIALVSRCGGLQGHEIERGLKTRPSEGLVYKALRRLSVAGVVIGRAEGTAKRWYLAGGDA